MFLIFLFLRIFVLWLFRCFGLFGRHIAASKQLIQQWKGCSLRIHIVIVGFFFLAKNIAHFITEGIQIFLADAHLLYSGINLGNPKTSGAFEAIAFIHGNAVLNLGDKYNRNVLFALGTHFGLHSKSLLCRGNSLMAV